MSRTDPSDENENKIECTHYQDSVDVEKCKRVIQKTGIAKECRECESNLDGMDVDADSSLWLCLKCGYQGCGNSQRQHAMQHFSTPHSDSHALFVNTTTWKVWCYQCETYILSADRQSSLKELQEAVWYFKQQSEQPVIKNAGTDKVDCPHFLGAFDFEKAKMGLSETGILKQCVQCKSSDDELWLCLTCGFQGCETCQKEHGLRYYTEFPDRHMLSVNTANWKVRCYRCDSYIISLDQKPLNNVPLKKLKGAVAYFQQQVSAKAAGDSTDEEAVKIKIPARVTHNSNLSDSSDENQNRVECPHIHKAVDFQKIKKGIQKTGLLTECEQCKKSINTSDIDMTGDYEFDSSLWLCLKCGFQACSRSKNQHALQHFNTPRSESHALCVNTTTWDIWCYKCDEYINLTAKKNLQEAVTWLRDRAEQSRAKSSQSTNDRVIQISVTPSSALDNSLGGLTSLPRVRGLANLGNTCFFNSVMQCLGQTPYLVHLLEETSQSGQAFRLPGGKLTLDDKTTIELDPLEGVLEEWRPLMRILAETLTELQSGRSEVYVPRMLFSRLTQRMPQFGGGDQHDAHELLRHLLEAVREEDLRRYQAVILDKLGHSRKTDPASVEGDKKKIVRFYGQQASELLLPTEQVFRGVLLSTLQCEECDHTSSREEFFLDLSLPISETQIPPILRRKAEEMEDNKPSKYQIKKEKIAAKKNKKKKGHGNLNNQNAVRQNSENNSDNESGADVEDNIDADEKKATESGYNSDKWDDSSSDIERMMCEDDNMSNPVVGILGAAGNESPENSQNMSMGSPICGRNSPDDGCNEGIDRPVSRLNSNVWSQDLKADFSKLSLLNNKNNEASDKMELDGEASMIDNSEVLNQNKKMEEEEEFAWGDTMSARYLCQKGECSVQSCLNQFTACELMTGANKVGCELCTKRHGGSEKKTVYTNARKQLLIYNPPAVLILHLKRFQVIRYRSTKVMKFVEFPTLLDLAPFCTKKSQNLPTFEVGQSRVLYSLYGVVEHSGSMLGGHYVAYVKVRPPLSKDDDRWLFLPKNQSKIDKKDRRGAKAEPEIPQGKWYYVSDSHVAEVSEAKVLKVQAYVLFYERIL